MSTTCPNCGWPQDQTVSRIDASSPQTEVTEGNAAAPISHITFTATRTGPSDQPCSVAAALSGTTTAADFDEGTAMSGVAHWEAGDVSPRSVTLALNPDRLVEGDEAVTVTISDPQGCTIGNAAATVMVVNDDKPPATTYDGNLPYGGQGMGTACLLGQPGNQRVTSTSAMMLRCERKGLVDRIQYNNRYNGHGRTGYSTGDGGVISIRLSIAKNAQSSPIDPGPTLGETRKITAPVNAASWAEEYKAAGGTGAVPEKFCEYPTWRLVKPVAVDVGDMLVWTVVQHNATRGTCSINNSYSECRTYDDFSPFSLHKACRQFKGSSLSTTRYEHYINLLYGYTDGVVKGTGAVGYSSGLSTAEECIILGGKTRARQLFTIPDWADGKTIKRVVSWWGRRDAVANGALRCRLKVFGKDPDWNTDEGEQFAEKLLGAGNIAYRPDPKFGAPSKLVRHVFDPPPRPLKAGEVISVEMSAYGNSYIGFRMVRWLSYAPVGLRMADWGMKGMGGMRTTGGLWQTLNVGGVNQDLPVWVEF